jgi:hypothetical protein
VVEFDILSTYLSRWTDRNHERRQDGRCTSRDSNRIPPEYKSEVSALELVFAQWLLYVPPALTY